MIVETFLSSSPPLPQHIALIMDGNGRWALQHGLTRTDGHRAATRHLREITEFCIDMHIPYLTLYTFSTENWRRPKHEVQGMFKVMADFLDHDTTYLHSLDVQMRHIGRLDGVDEHLRTRAQYALDLTFHNRGLILTVAFNYSGRADIIDAVRAIVASGRTYETINEQTLDAYLSTCNLPDPDLVIRTSGEQRLSNFLLWETAYSTCWTTPVYWPDFRLPHLREAIEYYTQCHSQMHAVAE